MHLNLHHHVSVEVTSSDTAVLDAVESAIPSQDEDRVGVECDGPRRMSNRPELGEGEEYLIARVVFDNTYDTNGDVHRYAETHAQNFYDELVAIDYGDAEYEYKHYKSPIGGVVPKQINEYYEENPDEKPTDDNGETYVPKTWDPSRYVVSEGSSE